MNRRGNIQDISFGIVMILVFAVTVIFTAVVFSELNTAFNQSGVITTQAKSNINFVQTSYRPLFDGAAVFVLVGLLVGIMGLAFVIRAQPAFALIGLFIVAIFVFVAAIISNLYIDMTSASALAGTANSFVATDYILTHLPLVVIFMCTFIGIIFYAKESL